MGEVVAKKGAQEGRDHHLEVRRRRRIGRRASRKAFEKGGGKVVKELSLPFPNVEFQALLTEIAGDQARRGVHVLRRRRRGEVRQGLRAAGLKKTHPAVRRRLPHRRHARGAGRRRRRPAHHAALRRRPGHAARQRLPRSPTPRPTSCSPTSMRCRATTRRRCSRRPERREGRRQQEGRVRRRRWRRRRSTARAAPFTMSQGAQPGAGHLPAPGERQGEQGRSASPARRSPTRPRLQDVAPSAPARARRRPSACARALLAMPTWTSPPSSSSA